MKVAFERLDPLFDAEIQESCRAENPKELIRKRFE
jgi:hypothetical protein